MTKKLLQSNSRGEWVVLHRQEINSTFILEYFLCGIFVFSHISTPYLLPYISISDTIILLSEMQLVMKTGKSAETKFCPANPRIIYANDINDLINAYGFSPERFAINCSRS